MAIATCSKAFIDLAIMTFASFAHSIGEPILVSLFYDRSTQFSAYFGEWFATFLKCFSRLYQVLGWPLVASVAGYFIGRGGSSHHHFSLAVWSDRFIVGGVVASTLRQANKVANSTISEVASSSEVAMTPEPSNPSKIDPSSQILDLIVVIGVVVLATLSVYLRDRASKNEGANEGITTRTRTHRRANRPPAVNAPPQQAGPPAVNAPPQQAGRLRFITVRRGLHCLALFLYKTGTTGFGLTYKVKQAHHGAVTGSIFYDHLVAVVVELVVTILVVQSGKRLGKLMCIFLMVLSYPAFWMRESIGYNSSAFYSMIMSMLVNGPISLITEYGAIDEHGKSSGISLALLYCAATMGDALAYTLRPMTAASWDSLTARTPMFNPLVCSPWIAMIALGFF